MKGVAAVKAAYEYTVDHVGEDVDSGPLWLDYVGFLKKSHPTHVCPLVKPEQVLPSTPLNPKPLTLNPKPYTFTLKP